MRRFLISVLAFLLPWSGSAQQSRHFTFRYTFTIRNVPQVQKGEIWFPTAHADPFQGVHVLSISGDLPLTKARETKFGNTLFHAVAPGGLKDEYALDVVYDVVRYEHIGRPRDGVTPQLVKASVKEANEYLTADKRSGANHGGAAEIIRPKVLVIATYETGQDRGDVPGELQYWAERQKLDIAVPLPGLDHPLLTNGSGLYAMVSGTTSRCAVQIMALAMNPTLDLTHTYILLSGIGGADPATVTVGSAVWVRQVIDGDPAFEIDSREIPAAWPYGTIALGTTEPGKVPANLDNAPAAGVSDNGSGGVGKIVYDLNPKLVNWAYSLTKNMHLADSPELKASRARFTGDPIALEPPKVIEGDSLGTDHFWHGAILNRWAEDWVRLYTRGRGSLAIADCEDQGIVLAIEKLHQLGRVDQSRLLVLRTASNFTVPPPGVLPAKSLFENLASSPGYLPSLEANYQVGSVVTNELLRHWDQYQERVP